jgi:hypothetical protein
MEWMLAGLRKFNILVGSFSRRTLDGVVQQMSCKFGRRQLAAA